SSTNRKERHPMSFKMVLLPPDIGADWPDKIRQAVPGAQVEAFQEPAAAREAIVDADAAYGTVPRELLARAAKLRWIAAPRAGRRLVLRRSGEEPSRRHQPERHLQRSPGAARHGLCAGLRAPVRPLPAAAEGRSLEARPTHARPCQHDRARRRRRWRRQRSSA